MTYIACVLNKNGIVVATDSRANYFEDYKENGEVKGKLIKFYWDGNKKLFLIKNKFAVAVQGLLFWGEERKLLSKYIEDFKNSLNNKLTVKEVATKIHKYTLESKRKNNSLSEVMHFLVCGIEEKIPIGFYINTYYKEKKEGVQKLPFSCDKSLYVNGDGKAQFIENVLSINEATNFAKSEVLNKHKEKPYDVGNKIDILVIPAKGNPFWREQSEESNDKYTSYDKLINAIKNNNVKIQAVSPPVTLRYEHIE